MSAPTKCRKKITRNQRIFWLEAADAGSTLCERELAEWRRYSGRLFQAPNASRLSACPERGDRGVNHYAFPTICEVAPVSRTLAKWPSMALPGPFRRLGGHVRRSDQYDGNLAGRRLLAAPKLIRKAGMERP